jgi:excisionase family DNA binding protein
MFLSFGRELPMKKIRDPDQQFLTRAEVAKIFKVSPSTITRWAEAGKLPVIKTLGGHRRYEAKAVMALAQQFIRKEISMEKTSIEVPTMYGDHHVIEVRRILLEMPGVDDVNASSCFHVVEVDYEPDKVSVDDIKAKLDEAGYLGELAVPVETGIAVTQQEKQNGDAFFRHTAAYEQTKSVVSFAQTVSYSGRPLWPCPGVGVIKQAETEETPNG